MWDDIVCPYRFPDPLRPQWFVCCSHSTGSSMDGTRKHYWAAVRFTHAIRYDTTVFDSEEQARKVADLFTADNVQPC